MEPNNSGSGLAIASLVCGIISIIACCCWFLGLTLGILAIIFSVIYKKQGGHSGMATAGLICGILGVILSASLLIFSRSVAYLDGPSYSYLLDVLDSL